MRCCCQPVSKERRGHRRTSLREPFFKKKELTLFPGYSDLQMLEA